MSTINSGFDTDFSDPTRLEKHQSKNSDEAPLSPLIPEADMDQGFEEFYRSIIGRLSPQEDAAFLPFMSTLLPPAPAV